MNPIHWEKSLVVATCRPLRPANQAGGRFKEFEIITMLLGEKLTGKNKTMGFGKQKPHGMYPKDQWVGTLVGSIFLNKENLRLQHMSYV